jgi:O-antigen/teichoic acid export membrane protein
MRKLITFLKSKYIGDSQYKKNISILVGGRVIAQIIPILLTPVVTRIYSPEEFGVFGVYLAIASFLAMMSNGRYSQAILLPKDKEKAGTIVFLSSIITLFFSFFLLLTLYFTQETFSSILNIKLIHRDLLLLIFNIIFLSLYDIFFIYELREKRYKKLAINIIIQATVTIIIRILLGYRGYTETGLLISYLAGYIIAYLLLLFKTDYRTNLNLLVTNGKSLLKEYMNFPKFVLISDSLMSLVTYSPSIFLNRFFGSDSAGYYALSEKVLGSPIWFVTSSVGDVFRQEASEKYRNGENCGDIFKKTTRTLFLLGIIPFLLIFLIVPPLIPFLFGSAWSSTGDYIRILSIMYFSSFIVNPVSYIVYIVKKQKYAVLYQGIKVLSIIIAFSVGYYFENLILGLILWSVLVTVVNTFILIVSYKFAMMGYKS